MFRLTRCASFLGVPRLGVSARPTLRTGSLYQPAEAVRTAPPAARMSSTLAEATCVPCRKGAPSLSPQDITAKLGQLNDATHDGIWSVSELSQAPGQVALQRSFKFRNFKTALAFTNAVGAVAEEQKHHPMLVLEWGSVHVAWWTHATGGVSRTALRSYTTEALIMSLCGASSLLRPRPQVARQRLHMCCKDITSGRDCRRH